jgi:hypothetical protein
MLQQATESEVTGGVSSRWMSRISFCLRDILRKAAECLKGGVALDSESSDRASSLRSRWLRGCATGVGLSMLIMIVACGLGYTSIRQGLITPPEGILRLGPVGIRAELRGVCWDPCIRLREPGDPPRIEVRPSYVVLALLVDRQGNTTTYPLLDMPLDPAHLPRLRRF